MRTIIKHTEPASLAEYRSTAGADYAAYRDKSTLRRSLVSEQRGLCCYCLSRIRPEPDAMKIEHWHSQANYSVEQLDYSNLLGSCLGNEGKARPNQHCDTFKGDGDLSRNPANPTHRVGQLTRFRGDGTVFSDDPFFDSERNAVLNLNLPFLVENRKAILDGLKEAIPKLGPLRRGTLEKWLLDWNGESNSGELKPFCQVVVYWIQKRLARL